MTPIQSTARPYQSPVHSPVFEPSPRRVRVKFGGEFVADSTRVMLLRESGVRLWYTFPEADVRTDLLEKSDYARPDKHYGDSQYWTVKVGEREARHAAWGYTNPPEDAPPLKGYITFKWGMMDGWYEEDEEVFVHPRDPYHRVDSVASSRHVKVVLGGEVVAESSRPYLLFETGLPTRYYLPRDDVRVDLLEATDSHSVCPYKGTASYWSAKIGDRAYDDIVWSYPDPIPESPKIKELMCFYNERVDELYVDGELQATPQTAWSK